MASTIRIKRTSTSNRPATLKNAELAFIEGSSTLVIGTGVSGESWMDVWYHEFDHLKKLFVKKDGVGTIRGKAPTGEKNVL